MSEALLKVPDAALEQARMMLDRARWGATRFQKLDRSTTQRIVNAVAAAAHGRGLPKPIPVKILFPRALTRPRRSSSCHVRRA